MGRVERENRPLKTERRKISTAKTHRSRLKNAIERKDRELVWPAGLTSRGISLKRSTGGNEGDMQALARWEEKRVHAAVGQKQKKSQQVSGSQWFPGAKARKGKCQSRVPLQGLTVVKVSRMKRLGRDRG